MSGGGISASFWRARVSRDAMRSERSRSRRAISSGVRGGDGCGGTQLLRRLELLVKEKREVVVVVRGGMSKREVNSFDALVME